MSRIHWAAAAAVTTLTLLAAPQVRAADYLLQLEGVKGEGTDGGAPIQVDSFSWGVHNAGTTASGGKPPTGKVAVQDLSMTKANLPSARETGSGMATGRRTAVADSGAVAVPSVGDVASFTVALPDGAAAPGDAVSRACAKGTHFPKANVSGNGRTFELSDVTVTSCATIGAQRQVELKGHVTLIK